LKFDRCSKEIDYQLLVRSVRNELLKKKATTQTVSILAFFRTTENAEQLRTPKTSQRAEEACQNFPHKI
jgi:hypothetical protein